MAEITKADDMGVHINPIVSGGRIEVSKYQTVEKHTSTQLDKEGHKDQRHQDAHHAKISGFWS